MYEERLALLFRFPEITGAVLVSFRATHAVHRAAETDGARCLVFFEVAAGAGAQPVSTVVPATTFVYPCLIGDQGGLAIAIARVRQAVTIEEVDDVSTLVVAAVAAFGVSYVTHLNTAHAIHFRFTASILIECLELITTDRGYVFHVK